MKIRTVDLYGVTTDPEEHLGVYKVQMYVQDVDDTAHCRFNGLAPARVFYF